jgi:hypothetical protein
MATRGAREGGSTTAANAELPPQARATVATAERAGGAAVGEAIGAIKNAGGGELKIKANDATGMGVLKTMLPSNFLTDEKGNVAVFNPENEFKVFDTNGKEIKIGNTITVMVTENGLSIKNLDAAGRLMPLKTKADISPDLALAINDQFTKQKGEQRGPFTVGEGQLPANFGFDNRTLNEMFTVKGTGRTKEEKDAKAARQKARDLGIEGIAND